jgi:hypothetical protein
VLILEISCVSYSFAYSGRRVALSPRVGCYNRMGKQIVIVFFYFSPFLFGLLHHHLCSAYYLVAWLILSYTSKFLIGVISLEITTIDAHCGARGLDGYLPPLVRSGILRSSLGVTTMSCERWR